MQISPDLDTSLWKLRWTVDNNEAVNKAAWKKIKQRQHTYMFIGKCLRRLTQHIYVCKNT